MEDLQKTMIRTAKKNALAKEINGLLTLSKYTQLESMVAGQNILNKVNKDRYYPKEAKQR